MRIITKLHLNNVNCGSLRVPISKMRANGGRIISTAFEILPIKATHSLDEVNIVFISVARYGLNTFLFIMLRTLKFSRFVIGTMFDLQLLRTQRLKH